MAIEIKVPDIGTDEVEITEILVKVGDKVEAEQSLITVEGDKASMEVPSPQAGVVKEIKVSVGDKTETGALTRGKLKEFAFIGVVGQIMAQQYKLILIQQLRQQGHQFPAHAL
ncbi:hypothetical protein MJL62_23390, partial [Salmonella enterica subsp. enterica serovar Montevideo]|nr:hypothetical protein [Salmonella enterica subsp. enterica serovar Montevideo]